MAESVVGSDDVMSAFDYLFSTIGEETLAAHLRLNQMQVLAIHLRGMPLPPGHEDVLFAQAALQGVVFAQSNSPVDVAPPGPPPARDSPGPLPLPSVAASIPGSPRPTQSVGDASPPPRPSVVVEASVPVQVLPPAAVLPPPAELDPEEDVSPNGVVDADYQYVDAPDSLLDPALAAPYLRPEPVQAPSPLAPAEAAPSVSPAGHVAGVDMNRDGTANARPIGLVPVGGHQLSPSQERKRQSLRNARALAVMTQFRLGMNYQEQLAALGLVTQIELALISHFREAVPDPSKHWDAHRVDEEVQRRLARLRWVEREQEREHTGFRGAWNWLMGRGRISGRELYERMIDEADALLVAMSEDIPATEMDVVMRYSGLDTYV